MTAIVLRGDARQLPLPDGCVDLIVTSPPYFGLRSYTDGGEHYHGQIGGEATPQEWLAALWECTAEWCRVLKPEGSLFVNLGDKYAGVGGSNGHGWCIESESTRERRAAVRVPLHQGRTSMAPKKSLLGLPWRYALGCVGSGWPHQREAYIADLTDRVLDDELEQDEFWRRIRDYDARNTQPKGLGLILRAEIIWAKPNGLPESVTDRVRRAHEQVFHLVKQPRYYAAVDAIREPHGGATGGRQRHAGTDHYAYLRATSARAYEDAGVNGKQTTLQSAAQNPLGKLPGSVWNIPSAPLQVPAHLGVDHFAAFPPALVRPLVLGWSPPGVCTGCGQGRRPIVDKAALSSRRHTQSTESLSNGSIALRGGFRLLTEHAENVTTTITGYACACPSPDAPTRPAIVLDPFAGTGTTMLVASTHGRVGVGVDRSMDYARLAQWRCSDPGERARARDLPKPPPVPDGMDPLFEMGAT